MTERPATSWSLSRRLLWPLILIVLVTAVIQILLVYRAMLTEANEVFDAQLKQTAQALVQSSPGGTVIKSSSDVAAAEELDLIIRDRSHSRELRSTPQDIIPNGIASGFQVIETSQGKLRVFTARTDGRTVSVGQRLAARRQLAREIALSALWPLVALAVLGLLLVGLVIRSALRPVAALKHQVEMRAPMSMEAIKDPGLPSELTPLLGASNHLLERLSVALAQQRRFLADAAHELRTPIAAIRLQNTLVSRAQSDQERRIALQAQEAGILRAASLVDQLLRLSRLESMDAPLRPVMVDLLSELNAAAQIIAPEVDEKHMRLEIAGDSIEMAVDADLLKSVLANLVGNAVRHGHERGRVQLSLLPGDCGPLIHVDDDGPGIAPEVLPDLLKPFHRNAAAGTSGTGLGLAIVHAACARAGWVLDFGRSPLGGLRASVCITSSQA